MKHYRDMTMEERVKRLERILDEVIWKIESDHHEIRLERLEHLLSKEPDQLYLYEIRNGREGQSYERIYVIEDNDDAAINEAFKTFDLNVTQVKFRKMPIIKGFVSKVSDSGLEIEDTDLPPGAQVLKEWQLDQKPNKTREVTPRQGQESHTYQQYDHDEVIHHVENEYGWLTVTQNTGTKKKEWRGGLNKKGLAIAAECHYENPEYEDNYLNIGWIFPGYDGKAWVNISLMKHGDDAILKGIGGLTYLGKPIEGKEKESC